MCFNIENDKRKKSDLIKKSEKVGRLVNRVIENPANYQEK